MKTKFSVEIHRNGQMNDAIIRMITNHNEGKVQVDLELMVAHCKAAYAQYPTITPDTKTEVSYPSGTLNISENDKPTLTITSKKVELLTPSEQDLLTQEKLS